VAITPDGATAYVTDSGSDTVTPVTVASGLAGTPIAVGADPLGVTMDPNGATAYVTGAGSNSVTPVTVATGTAGPAIAVGSRPTGVAVTPDQAPTAAFTVAPAAAGSPTRFDGSASGAVQGRILNYAWAFGDGTTSETNGTALTTHTYAMSGPITATLTVTDTSGTSTSRTYTGGTVADNGASSAELGQSFTILPATAVVVPPGSAVPAAPAAPAVTPPPTVLTFAGYQWTVRSSASPIGPGPNTFDATGPSVNAAGDMVLRIVKTPSGWESSEVILGPTLGYGTYRWVVKGSTTSFDPNVVLGLITYDDSNTSPTNREIDFEASRWSNASNPDNAQYVVAPYYTTGNLQGIAIPKGQETVVALSWTPGRVSFSGDVVNAHGKTVAIQPWTNTSSSVPTSATEQIHMNLWLFRGAAPTNGKPVTVRISGFQFTPSQ
jgi:hypothetical protein